MDFNVDKPDAIAKQVVVCSFLLQSQKASSPPPTQPAPPELPRPVKVQKRKREKSLSRHKKVKPVFQPGSPYDFLEAPRSLTPVPRFAVPKGELTRQLDSFYSRQASIRLKVLNKWLQFGVWVCTGEVTRGNAAFVPGQVWHFFWNDEIESEVELVQPLSYLLNGQTYLLSGALTN